MSAVNVKRKHQVDIKPTTETCSVTFLKLLKSSTKVIGSDMNYNDEQTAVLPSESDAGERDATAGVGLGSRPILALLSAVSCVINYAR